MKNYFKVWGLSLGLLLAFCVPLSASAASCNGWGDIQSGTTLCTAAKYAYDQSIMYGYGSVFGAFKPGSYGEQFVNRAEAMAIILRALDAKYFYTIDTVHTPYADTFPFSDLPSGQTQWWYSYLRRMLDLGGVKGYADGTFQGGKRVTRAEFVKMFLNLTPYKNDILNMDVYGKQYFTGDLNYKLNAWYTQYFAFIETNYPLRKAFQNNRCPAPNYCPDYDISRDEAALFLYYYHQWAGQDLGTTNPNPTPTPPPTPPTTLGIPVLFSPNDNMTYYGTNPTVNFNWYSTKGAVKYDLMLKYGANANYAVYQTVNPNYTVPASYFPSLSLSPGGYVHRWKVRAYDADGNWQDSAERTLYVYNSSVSAPSLLAPSNGATYLYGTNIPFSWSQVSNASSYQLMFRSSNSSSYTTYTTNTTSFPYSANNFVVAGVPYYWKVRVFDANGNSKDTDEWYFYVNSQQISAPTLVSPNNNQSYNGNQNTTFTWNGVSGATKYDFMIQYGNSNSYMVYTVGPNVTQYYIPAASFPSVANTSYTHYWKVRAYDANNNWKESDVRALTVNPFIFIPII